jgi:peptidyl-prolyl cis-trans isomerase C
MKKLFFPALALVAASVLAQQPAEPKIAATINGEVLTVDDVNRMYAALAPDMRARYDANGGKKQFVQQYIGKRLLVQEALKNNFDKKTDVAGALRDVRESTLFDLYVRDVLAAGIVTDQEVREYYDQNKRNWATPEMLQARHIIATPGGDKVMNTTGDNATDEDKALKKINDLLEAASANKSSDAFSTLALRFSEDASAPQGGSLGWFTRGQMVAEFDRAAFATKPGELSGIVKTQFGYHIILVEGHKPAGFKPFEDVAVEIRERLLAERADRVMTEVSALTMQLRQASRINVIDKNLE